MVRPEAFGQGSLFGDYMQAWTRNYLEAGGGNARLPGGRAARLEKEGREGGIELAPAIVRELTALGERLGVRLPG
jgi:LDH2 family malate/lactate/ureidoglycolate dehydrogenase